MSSKRWVLVVALIGVFVLGAQTEAPAAVRLVYMTAGDVNMLALGQNVLGPAFSQKYPGVSLMTVHTGPGDAGSRLIFEKISAEAESKKETWDVDVAMVHQIFLKWAEGKTSSCPTPRSSAPGNTSPPPLPRTPSGSQQKGM